MPPFCYEHEMHYDKYDVDFYHYDLECPECRKVRLEATNDSK